MLIDLFSWLWNRFRPKEGWLPFFLLWGAIGCFTAAITEAEWVAEGDLIRWTAVMGLCFGVGLGKRIVPAHWAWSLIFLYGITLTTLHLAQLWPPFAVLSEGWQGFAQFTRQQSALYVDRWAGWIQAVGSGGSSRETLPFAFGLGFGGWMLAAYAGWTAFHQRQPLTGLTPIGIVLAVSVYYSQTGQWTAVLFVPLATLLAAILNYAYLQLDWDRAGIDYAEAVRFDLWMTAGGVALLLMALAFGLPAIHIRAWTEAFLAQPVVQEAEKSLERAFAGVRTPRQPTIVRRRGQLPNDFLLGNPPELSQTVVFTATVEGIAMGGHWRGASYDHYTGQGWASSAERQEEVPAGIFISSVPLITPTYRLTQTVYLAEPSNLVYTIGLPQQFDQDVTLLWRGLEDLARVQANGLARYTAYSGLPYLPATVTTIPIPDLIQARYTQLPETVPARVKTLAEQITRPYPSPLAKAQAIESFLRQYPYSLEVELPPVGQDPVDYFLFDLQKGYCDYYASAMVVLARSVEMPARLAIGYLPQPTNEKGIQTISRAQAHSWAELYFAGIGWVEFESTAALPIRSPVAQDPQLSPTGEPFTPPASVAIPLSDTAKTGWWLGGGTGLLLLASGIWFWLRHRTPIANDELTVVYTRLLLFAHRLGIPTPTSQTPAEFAAAFEGRIHQWSGDPKRMASLRAGIAHLTRLFIHHQYASTPLTDPPTPSQTWRTLRPSLWLLYFSKRKS